MQHESGRSTGWRSSAEPLPTAIQAAVAAAMEDGVSADEIAARVCAYDGNRSLCAEGSLAEPMQGLIRLQREANRCAEEWAETREPGAEDLSALVAIEILRALVLISIAKLSKCGQPVSTEDLARLALTLHRIESTDRLRIEHERTAVAGGADVGATARAASMTHEERVDTVRRAFQEHSMPGFAESLPPASGWGPASSGGFPATPPDPTPDPPFCPATWRGPG